MDMDGSVCGISRGAGAVLLDSNNKVLMIRIYKDENPEELTSYRTELHVILGGFVLLMRLILPLLWRSAREILWTDSKTLLDKISMSADVPHLNKATLCCEFAILSKISQIRTAFPGIQIQWLESHQNITRVEQELNGISNKVAAMQHCAMGR